jgi:type IV pilus assembly protein PilO
MDKVRQWSMLTAVGVIAVLAAGWFLLVSPQRSHASALRAQAVSQQQGNDVLRTQVAALRAQQKDLPKEQARLAQIGTLIPDNPALPSLIRSLSDAADGAGVDLSALSPAPPTMVTAAVGSQPVVAGTAGTAAARPGATATGSATTAAQGAATPLAQIPVTLTVSGSYFNLEQFIASLETLKRAMKVTGFSVSAGPSAGGSAGVAGAVSPATPGALTASINAIVYMSPQVAAPAVTALRPAAPAAPAKK